jgi:eukaryotic-like serine/threonine-protein kinase
MTDQPEVRPLASDAPESPDPTIGLLVADRYRISSLLARGGMARVYRADDERLGREVAVKILGLPYAARAGFTERFLEEARAAAGISHPNLVHVYDSGSDRGLHFIVMELLERYHSVRERLASGGPLGVEETVVLGSQLLDGLDAVHARGLVHCDVKAGNVLLGPGPVKLIDFGIARVRGEGTGEGISIGSLAYMSPEQLRGESLGPPSDLFAVGVVLYEALTGELPFRGTDPEKMAAAHRAGVSRAPSQLRPEIPTRLDDAVGQALRPAPEQRFASAAAMRRALETAAPAPASDETTQVHTVARPAGAAPGSSRPSEVPPRPATRRRARLGWLGPLVILAAAVAVALLVIVPLLGLGDRGGPGPIGGTASPIATTIPVGNRVTVPNTIGLSKKDAIKAANNARLNWTIECSQDPAKPKGMIRQEPAPGTVVAAGSPLTMFSARIADCR